MFEYVEAQVNCVESTDASATPERVQCMFVLLLRSPIHVDIPAHTSSYGPLPIDAAQKLRLIESSSMRAVDTHRYSTVAVNTTPGTIAYQQQVSDRSNTMPTIEELFALFQTPQTCRTNASNVDANCSSAGALCSFAFYRNALPSDRRVSRMTRTRLHASSISTTSSVTTSRQCVDWFSKTEQNSFQPKRKRRSRSAETISLSSDDEHAPVHVPVTPATRARHTRLTAYATRVLADVNVQFILFYAQLP